MHQKAESCHETGQFRDYRGVVGNCQETRERKNRCEVSSKGVYDRWDSAQACALLIQLLLGKSKAVNNALAFDMIGCVEMYFD
jgi:hypothetical protein